MIRRDPRIPARVYFIRPVGAEGPVKIGCSQLPHNRLAMLSAWSPVPLEIVATIVGQEELERRFHAAFVSSWSHGEWFHASVELTSVIRQVAAGTFDIESLPAPKRLSPSRKGNGWSPYSRISASMSARLRALEKRGVTVPDEVKRSAFAYHAGQWSTDYVPFQPADAHRVQAFLSSHGYEPREVPPAPPANDDQPQSRAA